MGNLVLCHDKHAQDAYEIARIHCKIYTFEELCYFLTNNLYLVDYTLMNEQLVSWLEYEIEMPELANILRGILRTAGTEEKFILAILKYSKIYEETEMIRIQNVLQKLNRQPEHEKLKNKADNLLESGETEEAIIVYQSILNQSHRLGGDKRFQAKVYAGLGAAYGRLFLYKESANNYDRAFQISGDESLLKPYLYASSKYLTMSEYALLIVKDELYTKVSMEMKQDVERITKGVKGEPDEEQLEKWKRQYRRSHL